MPFMTDGPFDTGLSHKASQPAQTPFPSGWSVPWADLMMVMFVLFVVLFVYASQKRDTALLFARPSPDAAVKTDDSPIQTLLLRTASLSDPASEDSRQVYEKARQLLYSSNGGGVAVTMEADGGVRVNLGGAIVFAENSAEIAGPGLDYLDETAGLLAASPRRVHVVGYADTAEAGGDPAGQLRLSVDRAASAAQRLMASHGIEPERFAVSGRGAAGLLAPPTSARNRQKNRRIEIVILPDTLPEATGGTP